MIYLASPYSHPVPTVRRRRFKAVCRAAAVMLKKGLMVYSPIVHSVPIAACGLDAMDHDFWMHVDRPFLDWCSSVTVLMLPGWDVSKGVAAEIKIATTAGKPVSYLDPATVGISAVEQETTPVLDETGALEVTG